MSRKYIFKSYAAGSSVPIIYNYTGFDHNWRNAQYVAIVPIEDTYECYGLDSPDNISDLVAFMNDSDTQFLPIKVLQTCK